SIEDGMALATILQASGASLPAALRAYERLRRERVAQVQRGARENGLRYDSAYADLGVRDAEIAAHAAFRKRLYDHDVVPEAQAVAAALNGSKCGGSAAILRPEARPMRPCLPSFGGCSCAVFRDVGWLLFLGSPLYLRPQSPPYRRGLRSRPRQTRQPPKA